ncbi:hypothetical protein NQ176_g3397 [Zarea fungicola]|uniref:Uncharacterized protein n=1 Tax=Zarea fungicola TaxID=93591 RepID=A0ACC1NJS9_9HYPO|nr:hypothetical protein NQ176_g3397 [Lecanicillium fungicola]
MASAADAPRNQGPGSRQLPNEDYTVGWICALTTEYVAAQVFLDEEHVPPTFTAPHDNNDYTLGRIGEHNVAIAVLPGGEYGTASAASVARDMLHTFPNIRIGKPENGLGGVFQYDFGKSIQDRPFQSTRFLAPPPPILLTAISGLMAKYEKDGHSIQDDIETCLTARKRLRKKYSRPDAATDRLYRSDIVHPSSVACCSRSCGSDAQSVIVRTARDDDEDDPAIHYGLIATANQLMKDAKLRDQHANERGILCFEMEAGGLMNHFPCLVIRGICDYSDTHKNKEWQGYAAMTAAAYAKDLLKRISPSKIEAEKKISELLGNVISLSLDTKAAVQDLQTSSHFEKITKWLSSPDPSTNLNKARELHQPGTGQWLLDSEIYKEWKTAPASFLWLHGIPGCGKTILSSTVVADLANDPVASEYLVYFYFNFTDVNKRSTENAVRSLIDQLYRKSASARAVVDSLYATHEKSGGQPAHASLQQVLCDMIVKCCNVWIVLDGLDECETRGRYTTDSVLTWIENLRSSLPNVHILITSRAEEDIQSSFEAWAGAKEIVSLQSGLVADDIGAFVYTKVQQMARWRAHPDTQNLIMTTLNERANGMFRWIACQLDILEDCLDPIDIRIALDTLPQTLDETYNRIWQRIHTEHKSRTIRLLQLLTYSPRPLRIEEAVDAIAIEAASTPSFNPRNRMPNPREITRYCSSFVALTTYFDTENGEEVVQIQLAHFSVQEYFQSDRLPPDLAAQLGKTAAAASLVELCLSYLLALDISLSYDKTAEQYPFVEYSAQHWATHFRESNTKDDALIETARQICDPKSSCFRTWFRIFWAKTQIGIYPDLTTLMIASYLGLEQVVKLQLGLEDVDINAKDGTYQRSALSWASESGFDSVVELLINGPSFRFTTAITNPSALKGAIIDIKDRDFRTPLSYAACHGHLSIVKRLVKAQGSINISDSVQIPNRGIRTRSQREDDFTALGATVDVTVRLFVGMVRCSAVWLLSGLLRLSPLGGANVYLPAWATMEVLLARTIMYPVAFKRSIGRLLTDNVLLPRKSVDVDSKDKYNRTPLSLAAETGHDDVAALLIERGADVNAQDAYHRTPISYAAENGNTALVKLLLEHGAMVNTGSVSNTAPIEAGDVENMTPLHYTVRFSAIAAAELLLESHMCVDIAVRRRTWVHQSEESGSISCERLPSHTSAGKGLGLTPLHYAAWTGNVKMVAFFLRHGADPNAKSEFGETPLHLAIAKTIRGPQYLEYRDYWTEDDWRVEVLAYNARADGNYEQLVALDDLTLLVRMRVLGMLLDNGRTNVNIADDDGEETASFSQLHTHL